MVDYIAIAAVFIWTSISLSSQFVDAQTAPSIRIEVVPQGVITGCCSQALFNATSKELFSFVNTTTFQILRAVNLDIKNYVVNKFSLINTNLSADRERHLLRSNLTDGPLERKVRTSHTSCCSVSLKKGFIAARPERLLTSLFYTFLLGLDRSRVLARRAQWLLLVLFV